MTDNTNTTNDGYTPEQREYLQKMLDALPEQMTNGEIITAMGALMTSYADDLPAAAEILRHLTISAMAYYARNDAAGECQCPSCVAKRAADGGSVH